MMWIIFVVMRKGERGRPALKQQRLALCNAQLYDISVEKTSHDGSFKVIDGFLVNAVKIAPRKNSAVPVPYLITKGQPVSETRLGWTTRWKSWPLFNFLAGTFVPAMTAERTLAAISGSLSVVLRWS